MSKDVVIRVENLGKMYRIGARERQPGNAWQAARNVLSAPFAYLRRMGRPPGEEEILWALRDVSFEVKQGEVVGIIGRNGAGKSTLLKILSRITRPTCGRAEIHGRVGSLLEVGTGFHPELTGRENIYLNGAILGMRKHEIDRKFDEIVAFAEIEKFLDTPVKRYSSGMYVRLAFAVAAHLEPEILLVDEVLAVGDIAFQEKCLGKMKDVAGKGRTVLFVSHNMASIQHLCTRAFLLQDGRLQSTGNPREIISRYLSAALDNDKGSVCLETWTDRIGTGEARLIRLEISTAHRSPCNNVALGGSAIFTLYADFSKECQDPSFGVLVHTSLGEPLLDLRSTHDGLRCGKVNGRYVVECRLDQVGLYPGRYLLSPWIADSAVRRDIDFVKYCAILNVDPAPGPHGDLKLDPLWGKYWVRSAWRSVSCDSDEPIID